MTVFNTRNHRRVPRGPFSLRRVPFAGLAALAAVALTGCTTVRRTDPARTATEQLLLSTAADRAVARLGLGLAPGTRVALLDTRFESYDKPYVLGAVEDRLLQDGCVLSQDAESADVLVEVRSGGLSIDHSERLLGLPAIEIPVPFSGGALKTPELAIFKRDAQESAAKLALTARTRTDGKHVGSVGPAYGEAHVTRWVILLVGWTSQDVLPDD